MAAGYYDSCGLTNGTVRCWAWNGYGESTVPAITGGWKSVSAHYLTTCGILLADNSVRCWGDKHNWYGVTTVPAVTRGWKSLGAGGAHVCGVTKLNSTTLCWGYNGYGQTDVPKP